MNKQRTGTEAETKEHPHVTGLLVSACLFIFPIMYAYVIFFSLLNEVLKIFLPVYTRSLYLKNINPNCSTYFVFCQLWLIFHGCQIDIYRGESIYHSIPCIKIVVEISPFSNISISYLKCFCFV